MARAVAVVVVVAAMMTAIATADVAAALVSSGGSGGGDHGRGDDGGSATPRWDDSGSAPSISAVPSYLIKPITIPRYLTTVDCLLPLWRSSPYRLVTYTKYLVMSQVQCQV